MQLIFMRSHHGRALTITIGSVHLIAGGLFLAAGVVLSGLLGVWISVNHGQHWPLVGRWVEKAAVRYAADNDQNIRLEMQALGVRLGELQTQLVRLDVLGERLAKTAGVNVADLNFKQNPGRGGPYNPSTARDLSLQELAKLSEKLKKSVDKRGDALALFDGELSNASAASSRVPSAAPVVNVFSSSGFGWRLDPFTGRSTLHEGVDFNAPIGTPILAAAGGLVSSAAFHPQFGNLIEIDHGNGVVSRYAHASRFLVRAGEVVKRGQKIAEIGNTGRATGAHLHFEVRVNDAPVNPETFLAKNGLPRPGPAQSASIDGLLEPSR